MQKETVPSIEGTTRNEITTDANSSSDSVDFNIGHQPLEVENEEVIFTTIDNDDILADNTNPTSVELHTVPSRLLLSKTVSFSVLPAIETTANNPTTTTTTSNVANNGTAQRRRPLTKSSKSLPRLDLSSGLVYYNDNDDDEKHETNRKTKDGNTTNSTNKKPVREQLIQTIINIVPAGENSTGSTAAGTTTASAWSKLRQSVFQTTTLMNDETKQTPNEGERVNEEDAPSETLHTTSTHHYRIRSQRAHDPSFWILQTEIMAGVISRYVTWTYRSSFYVTIISSYIVFMGIMMLHDTS